jgi:hypothetical protein
VNAPEFGFGLVAMKSKDLVGLIGSTRLNFSGSVSIPSSNDAENLANVDFLPTPPLQYSVAPIRSSVIVFARNDVGPSYPRAPKASAAPKNFGRHVKKTLATILAPTRHAGAV